METVLLYNSQNQEKLYSQVIHYFNTTLKQVLNATTVIRLLKQGYILSHNKELTNIVVTKIVTQLLEDPLHATYLTSYDKFNITSIFESKNVLLDCFSEIAGKKPPLKKWWKCW